MTSHLTPDQLIDLAEGTRAESSLPHLQSCESCRRHLTDLRATMSMVAQVEAPEPSPLFWDRMSARVGEAIDIEREGATSWVARLSTAAGRLSWWPGPWPVRMAGVAVLVAAVGLLVRVHPPALSEPAPAESTSSHVDDGPLAIDDPSLSLVADLAAELDWEAAGEAGLTTHVGVDDDAVNQLTDAERRELRHLLQGELSPSRRGA